MPRISGNIHGGPTRPAASKAVAAEKEKAKADALQARVTSLAGVLMPWARNVPQDCQEEAQTFVDRVLEDAAAGITDIAHPYSGIAPKFGDEFSWVTITAYGPPPPEEALELSALPSNELFARMVGQDGFAPLPPVVPPLVHERVKPAEERMRQLAPAYSKAIASLRDAVSIRLKRADLAHKALAEGDVGRALTALRKAYFMWPVWVATLGIPVAWIWSRRYPKVEAMEDAGALASSAPFRTEDWITVCSQSTVPAVQAIGGQLEQLLLQERAEQVRGTDATQTRAVRSKVEESLRFRALVNGLDSIEDEPQPEDLEKHAKSLKAAQDQRILLERNVDICRRKLARAEQFAVQNFEDDVTGQPEVLMMVLFTVGTGFLYPMIQNAVQRYRDYQLECALARQYAMAL